MTTTADPATGPADPAADLFERRQQTFAEQLHHLLHRRPALSPLIVLILACIIFGLVNHRFLNPVNLSLIAQQVAVIGSLAVGQTLIILTAGIDLSIGAIMVLTALVMAKVAAQHHIAGIICLILGIVIAIVAEGVNGLLVTRIKLPPFIVTLGTLSVFTAISLIYAEGQTISLSPDSLLTWTAKAISIGNFRLTMGVILMVVLYLVIGFALRFTAWGRHLYAVGDDAEGSRLAGVEVDRALLGAYLVAGVAVLVAAWVLMGRVGGGDPNGGINANLESITAVVIGGTSLFGGRGALVGTLIGAFIVQVFDNGLALAGINPNYQVLAVGVLVIVAVSVDQWIRKVRS